MSDTPATRDFGLLDGRAVTGYVLSNRRGTRVCVLDLGGIVQEFSVLADGVRENLVVSFDDAASYADNPFQINKQIGRVAGRIRGAAFDINGRTYRVEANEGRNALHGGSHGLAVTRFDAVAADGRSVVLRSRLQQSVDGYPNDLDLDISYRLDEDDRLTVTYRATALGDTVFDPTLHIYGRLDAGLHDAVLHIPQGGHIPADAEKLPFPDNYFDLVSVSFGLRNMTHKDAALKEMYRVLKPGGTLLVLEFSKVAKPLAPAYDLYSFKLLPLMGKLIAKDADSYQYLAESIRMHPDQETLKQMMLDAGFDSVDYHNMSAGIVALHKGVKF